MLLGVSASGTLAVDPTQGTQPSRPATAPAASPLVRMKAIGWTPLTIAGRRLLPESVRAISRGRASSEPAIPARGGRSTRSRSRRAPVRKQ